MRTRNVLASSFVAVMLAGTAGAAGAAARASVRRRDAPGRVALGRDPSRTSARAAVAVPPVQLPADEAPHHDAVEWWYFNGHLTGRDRAGRVHEYGYEYVTFQFLGLGPTPQYFGDFAVTDLTAKTFHYGEEHAAHAVPVEHDSFALSTGPWSMRGTGTSDVLHAGVGGYSVQLDLRATRPAVLHGARGVVNLGPLGTSSYYSFTALRTTGTLVEHGTPVEVIGQSWMDHEWGAIQLFGGAGWDWFSLQLSDGRQYMLYFVKDKSGKVVQALGTEVGPQGSAPLAAAAIAERDLGSWTSPATGIRYGSGWSLAVPGGHLVVTPDLVDQELDLATTQGSVYWEGDSSVSGVVAGRPVHGVAYVELNPPGQL